MFELIKDYMESHRAAKIQKLEGDIKTLTSFINHGYYVAVNHQKAIEQLDKWKEELITLKQKQGGGS